MHQEIMKKLLSILFKDKVCLQTNLDPKIHLRRLASQVLLFIGDIERFQERFDSESEQKNEPVSYEKSSSFYS